MVFLFDSSVAKWCYMAHAKSSDIFSRRLRILDLANNSDQLSSKWLAEILNVSRRTIFRDIRLMRDAGVIIELSDNPYTDFDLTNAISLPNRCWVMMFYSILWNSMHAEHNENDLSSLWSNLIKSTRVKQQKILHSFPRSFFLSGNHFPPPISKDSLLNQMINALLTRKAFRCEYESHKTLFRPVAVYYTNT